MTNYESDTPFSRMTPAEQAEHFAKVRAGERAAAAKRRADAKVADDAKTAAYHAAQENAMKEPVRAEWLRNGGDAAQFDTAWPGIRAEILKQRAASAATRQRSASRVGF